ncbi:MAG: class II aldolase family protein, partial [bacterium (Candidatus Ratteibacteria) CG01_land_8_20_14_3_00_40_19]
MKMGKRLKQDLVRYGKKIIEKGLAVGPGGNISAREGNVIYLS